MVRAMFWVRRVLMTAAFAVVSAVGVVAARHELAYLRMRRAVYGRRRWRWAR
jgi:predicted alpha/beta-hydrolase family hydrolase